MSDFMIQVGAKVDTSDVQKQLDSMSKKSVVEVEAKLKTDSKTTIDAVKQTTKYTDELGNLAEVVKYTDKQGNVLSETITKTGTSFTNTSAKVKDTSTNLKDTSKNVDTLSGKFTDITKKVVAFGAVTSAIGLVTTGLREALVVVKEFDTALTEFTKVSSLSGDELSEYTQELGELGLEVARTTTEMTSSATEFKKSGFSEEDSAQLAQMSEMYRNVADSMVSSADSSAFLIAQMKSFDIEAENSIVILDQLNSIANSYAVSSSDIAVAVPKVSATLSQAGNEMSETYALLTGALELMPGQADRVARGFRSVTLNLQGMDEDGNEVLNLIPKMEEDFNKLGITLYGTDGQIKSTYDILGDLAGVFPTLTKNQQLYYAELIGGKTQVDVVNSVLKNYSTVVSANATALASSGSAMQENERYMESLEAKISLLRAEFEKFVLGEGGLTTFIKGIVDAGTAMLKFANNDFGKMTIAIVATTVALSKLNTVFGLSGKIALASNSAVMATSGGYKLLSTAIATTTKTVLASTKAFLLNPLFLGATAIITSIAVIDALTVTLEENREKLSEIQSEYDETTTSVDGLETSLNAVEERIKEINALDEINITSQQELDMLILEEARLESILALELKRQAEAKKALEEQAKITYEDTVANPFQEGEVARGTQLYESTTRAEVIADATKEMERQQQVLNDLNKIEAEGIELTDEQVVAKQEAIKTYDEAYDIGDKYVKQLQEETEGLSEQSDIYKKAQKVISDFAGEVIDSNDAIAEQIETVEDTVPSLEDATSAYQDSISNLGGMSGAYSTLGDAMSEYNSQGYLNLDTLEQLLSLEPEYLALLQMENGQMSLNEAGAQNLANAMIDKAQADAIAKAQAELNTLAQGNYNEVLSLGGSIASGTAQTIAHVSQVAIDSGYSAAMATNEWNNFWSTMTQQAMKAGSSTDGFDQVEKSLFNTLTTLESARGSIGQYTKAVGGSTGATKGNTGATKNNTSAIDKQTEALERQKEVLEERADILEGEIDEYDIVIDYVKDLLDEEQEAVEAEKEATLDAIQEKIDKLEEEKEAYEETIEAEIEAMEKRQDEIEKFYDDEIDKIEEQNDALEDNLELQRLQEQLSRARTSKLKVLRDGEFVYETDFGAVSEATDELADYERQLAVERQIAELEKLKEQALDSLEKQIEKLKEHSESVKDNYDQQVEDLQDFYDEKEKEYDEQIAQYEAYRKEFEDMLNATAKAHAEALYNELVGEQGNWDARIDALSKFVSDYEKKKSELSDIKNQIDSLTQQINSLQSSATQSLSGMQGSLNKANAIATQMRQLEKQVEESESLITEGYLAYANPQFFPQVKDSRGNVIWEGNKHSSSAKALMEAMEKQNNPSSSLGIKYGKVHIDVRPYAKGTYAVRDDEMALIGDPTNMSNKELVIGSSMNRGMGVFANLQKGTGVIPAKETNTLTKTLTMMAQGRVSNLETIEKNSEGEMTSIHIENLNVKADNADDFVREMKNIKTRFIQKTYQR